MGLRVTTSKPCIEVEGKVLLAFRKNETEARQEVKQPASEQGRGCDLNRSCLTTKPQLGPAALSARAEKVASS